MLHHTANSKVRLQSTLTQLTYLQHTAVTAPPIAATK